jgi:hypothetical protein
MKVSQRLALTFLLVVLGLCLAACSTDPSQGIAGPADSLERRLNDGPFRPFDRPLLDCSVTALDIFGNGGGMPFELSCEDMGMAELEILREEQNENGCLVKVRGRVTFTDNGHQYGFTASTNNCHHDGGTLVVCSAQLAGCVTVGLPHISVEPEQLRDAAK